MDLGLPAVEITAIIGGFWSAVTALQHRISNGVLLMNRSYLQCYFRVSGLAMARDGPPG